ncbi:eukaryotic cytochrome b561 domain-containing protein [Phthorimaea operculella]|nr:eukaryotic cytochrome b561 domain-containing protein [Phthorimaea operculella]
MGLFGIQYAAGFFSFLLLMICNKGTAGFRASLVPVHAAFGILTFVLGVCACLTGLTEKALFVFGSDGDRYSRLPDEAIIINVIGATMIAILGVVMFILSRDKFRASEARVGHIRASVDLQDVSTTQYWQMDTEAIIINAIAMSIVAVAILVLYTVRGTGGYRFRKAAVAAQHPS